MIALLERAAAAAPSHTAVVTQEHSRSYAELLGDARAIAAALSQRDLRRSAVVERDAALVIALLAGAALAGEASRASTRPTSRRTSSPSRSARPATEQS
jgi:acyl-CoA synthetase (AMP-forming)/AMP-acid ligase II